MTPTLLFPLPLYYRIIQLVAAFKDEKMQVLNVA